MGEGNVFTRVCVSVHLSCLVGGLSCYVWVDFIRMPWDVSQAVVAEWFTDVCGHMICRYADQKGWAAMLNSQLAGVALKPRADITKVENRGISGATKGLVSSKNF